MSMRLSRSIVGEKEAEAVARVICQDGYLGMGEATRKFEQDIAAYLGVNPSQVISVNSGTAALHLAVEACRVIAQESGRMFQSMPEVLVPTLTFVSCFQAIRAAGCLPVACDVLLRTGTLDLGDCARRVNDNTLAIMFVDYASNPWHLDEAHEFAEKRGLRVVEDAAHAFGCRYQGRKVGSFGDLVCFSFDGIKNITCGEGGCVVAFDGPSAEIIADSRLLGVQGDTKARFNGARSWDPDVARPGLRYHLSNILAAIGSVQLKRLESEFIPARQRLYKLYKKRLENAQHIRLLQTEPGDYIVPHIMPVRVLEGKKPAVLSALEAANIQNGLHYKPNHLLSLFGAGKISLPNAEQLYRELVTLPLHPGLSDADVERVCAVVLTSLE